MTDTVQNRNRILCTGNHQAYFFGSRLKMFLQPLQKIFEPDETNPAAEDGEFEQPEARENESPFCAKFLRLALLDEHGRAQKIDEHGQP
jgi:hypothetical protein